MIQWLIGKEYITLKQSMRWSREPIAQRYFIYILCKVSLTLVTWGFQMTPDLACIDIIVIWESITPINKENSPISYMTHVLLLMYIPHVVDNLEPNCWFCYQGYNHLLSIGMNIHDTVSWNERAYFTLQWPWWYYIPFIYSRLYPKLLYDSLFVTYMYFHIFR